MQIISFWIDLILAADDCLLQGQPSCNVLGDCITHLGGRENWELHHGHNHLMPCSTLPTLKWNRLIYESLEVSIGF